MIRLLQFIVLILSTTQVFAIDASTQFSSAEQKERFHDLAQELRCLVCQNQTLADSDAALALDLRKEIILLMENGKTDQEIIRFLVDRYGDFILYRPPFKSTTILLWGIPIILFIIGIAVLIILIRRKDERALDHLSKEEIEQINKMIK